MGSTAAEQARRSRGGDGPNELGESVSTSSSMRSMNAVARDASSTAKSSV
jgi:hypothetical protein